jgi:transposase InsO family protein/transposase-like protein
MRKKVGTSTYIQRINTLERKLLKQVKELDDVMQKHPEIIFRLQVVEFALKHSVKLAVEAFGVSKSTIYRWIKNYKSSNNNPLSLKNRYVSKKGMKLEKLQKITEKHKQLVLEIRKKHPKLGKEKIKVLLDELCKQHNIPTISASSIGNIIKMLKDERKLNHEYARQRITINARTGKLMVKEDKKKTKKDRYKDKKPTKPGELVQIDTKHEYVNGRKVYIFVAKDVKTRMSFTFAYDRLNSKNAKDFLEKLINVMPFEIKGIQTDNGSEFLGEFTKALKKKDIKHYFNYPRYPKGQAYVERMNRTLQDEFIMYYEDYELEDIHEFNKKMLQYMLWYNTERPHHSLNKKSPLQYFCDIMNSRKSEFSQTGITYTQACLT